MANNNFDMVIAKRFYSYLENIPIEIYTKVIIYIINIPVSIFNNLGDTGHPISKDLQSHTQRQGVQFYKTVYRPNPVNSIIKEKFLYNLNSFYEKYSPGIQLSEKGIPFLENGTPLPDPGKDFDPNEKFDPDKYDIIPYLTKGLLYNMLSVLVTGGDILVSELGVLDTESIANQTSIYKIIGTPKLQDIETNSNIYPERIVFVISTLLKGELYDSVQNSPGS